MYWLGTNPGVVPVGVDLSEDQVAIARTHLPGIEVACADGLTFLRENPERFSGIFCFDLLEHIPQQDDYLVWFEAALEALKPGGFFCCRTPNAANLTGDYSRYMDLTQLLSRFHRSSAFRGCSKFPLANVLFSPRPRPPVPMENASPSDVPWACRWQVAQETSRLPLNIGSKNRARPSLNLSLTSNGLVGSGRRLRSCTIFFRKSL